MNTCSKIYHITFEHMYVGIYFQQGWPKNWELELHDNNSDELVSYKYLLMQKNFSFVDFKAELFYNNIYTYILKVLLI